jgi:Carboxypeptidase regulatory-like domain/TonB dependent receptor
MAATVPTKIMPILALLGAALSVPAPSFAVSPLVLSGTLAGTVRDLVGNPQMGAVVFLYDHRDKLCERILTDSFGNFVFKGLNPDLYSVRVTMASFLPALRNRIQILPGAQKNLEVSLSTLFSSVQLVTPQPGQSPIMTDDWKWVVRTASGRRPVLRILPDLSDQQQQQSTSIFSDTHGLVKLSGGDGNSVNEADMGTAFGVATSVFGANQLQVVGNVGVASATGMPSAGFKTTLSRRIGDSTPSISVTMRQLSVPSHFNAALAGVSGLDSNTPFLRMMSLSMSNKTQLSDELSIEYGMELDSLSYLSHNHYSSPYAKLTYILPFAEVDFTYTAGNARPDLGAAPDPGAVSADLEREVTALAMIPRLSLLNNQPKMQTGQNYELGISRALGSREVRVTAYRESVKNAALTVSLPSAGPSDPFAGYILPDLFSDTSVLNAGDYHTLGYTAALTQNLGDNYHMTVSYGLAGVLVAGENGNAADPVADYDALRGLIRATHRSALTTQASGTIPKTGTKFSGSYQFTDYRAATSGHLYATDPSHPEAGLNFYIRQPIPKYSSILGHMEATVDLRNMLAQGYMPFTLTDGRRLLLMRTPRSVRGGLSFTF